MKTAKVFSFTAAALITSVQLALLAAVFSSVPVPTGSAFEQTKRAQDQRALPSVLVAGVRTD